MDSSGTVEIKEPFDTVALEVAKVVLASSSAGPFQVVSALSSAGPSVQVGTLPRRRSDCNSGVGYL